MACLGNSIGGRGWRLRWLEANEEGDVFDEEEMATVAAETETVRLGGSGLAFGMADLMQA